MKTFLLIISITATLNSFSQTTFIPDVNFEQQLIDLGYDSGSPDGSVPTANISSVTFLAIANLNISDLTGIQDFSSLTFLLCGDNLLTSLDLTQNTALSSLFCENNLLTSLNLSMNTALTELICHHNQLICLNIANGNNINLGLLGANNNPGLTCITVDDVAWATSHWHVGGNNIDPQTSFSTNCGNPCSLGIIEFGSNTSKKVSKVLDMTGREISFQKNTLMLYIYEDGSSEKVFEFE